VTNPDNIEFPPSNVSYSRHVQPFFTLRCYPCHDGYNAAGGIQLTTYSHVMFDRPNLVVPTRPDESLIMMVLDLRILHNSGNIGNIPSSQTLGVRTWITEGALNN
jgi:hypothetical protein